MVGRESARLERLVGDLLALARLRQGVLEVRSEPVDLAAVAREAEERLRPRAREAGVEVRVEGGAAPRSPTRGAPCRSSPTCSTTRSGSAPRRRGDHRGRPRRDAVSDQGPGIPEAEMPSLRALPPARPAGAAPPTAPALAWRSSPS